MPLKKNFLKKHGFNNQISVMLRKMQNHITWKLFHTKLAQQTQMPCNSSSWRPEPGAKLGLLRLSRLGRHPYRNCWGCICKKERGFQEEESSKLANGQSSSSSTHTTNCGPHKTKQFHTTFRSKPTSLDVCVWYISTSLTWRPPLSQCTYEIQDSPLFHWPWVRPASGRVLEQTTWPSSKGASPRHSWPLRLRGRPWCSGREQFRQERGGCSQEALSEKSGNPGT